MSTAARRVGVIGLGAMGQGVARTLLARGFDVHGCDVRAEAAGRLAQAGGVAHAAPADVAAHCDVLILLVVNEAQVEAVLFGDRGAVATMRSGGVIVCSATVPPPFVERLALHLERHGLMLLDAPVTGGVAGAEQGTLTFLAAGPTAAFEAAEGALAAVSARVFRFGEAAGLGAKAKVINQLLVGVQIAAAAEAIALAQREGLPGELVLEAVRHGAGNSWAFSDRAPRMVAGDFATRTALDIFVKDLGLVLDTARASAWPTPLAATAYQMFASVSAAGLGCEDDSGVIRFFPRPA